MAKRNLGRVKITSILQKCQEKGLILVALVGSKSSKNVKKKVGFLIVVVVGSRSSRPSKSVPRKTLFVNKTFYGNFLERVKTNLILQETLNRILWALSKEGRDNLDPSRNFYNENVLDIFHGGSTEDCLDPSSKKPQMSFVDTFMEGRDGLDPGSKKPRIRFFWTFLRKGRDGLDPS